MLAAQRARRDLHLCSTRSVGKYGPSRMLKNSTWLFATTRFTWLALHGNGGSGRVSARNSPQLSACACAACLLATTSLSFLGSSSSSAPPSSKVGNCSASLAASDARRRAQRGEQWRVSHEKSQRGIEAQHRARPASSGVATKGAVSAQQGLQAHLGCPAAPTSSPGSAHSPPPRL